MAFHWEDSLIRCLNDPSKILFKDDLIAIIADAYPKSVYHFLVISLDPSLNSIIDLKRDHICFVDHMHQKAIEFSKNIKTNLKFKYGFHIRPSMNRLHLHVLTSDHNSKYLQTKHHYNSFNTEFFQTPESVINKLQNFNQVIIPSHRKITFYLNSDLVCNHCGQSIDSISILKKHLKKHFISSEFEKAQDEN